MARGEILDLSKAVQIDKDNTIGRIDAVWNGRIHSIYVEAKDCAIIPGGPICAAKAWFVTMCAAPHSSGAPNQTELEMHPKWPESRQIQDLQLLNVPCSIRKVMPPAWWKERAKAKIVDVLE